MEGVLKIFPNMLSNVEYLELYLSALDEHLCTNVSHSEANNVLQSITTLLSTATGRLSGLKILNKLMGRLPAEMLGSKLQLWTTFLLKACNPYELELYGGLIYNVIRKFAALFKQPDHSKVLIANYLPKIFESVVICPPKNLLSAIKCAEAYLRSFPGPSTNSRGILMNFLKKFIDADDSLLNKSVGRCLLLMQQLGGGGSNGINHKIQWKQYQLELIGSLNEILDQMFVNCTEIFNSSKSISKVKWEIDRLELSSEPTLRFAQLFVRFQNISTYLEIAIRCPFSVNKCFLPKKLLNLLKRSIDITYFRLNANLIYDNIALGLFLPGMQKKLLQILNALILTMRGNLRSHCDMIFSCLIQILKSTSLSQRPEISKKPFRSLRAEIYKSIFVWCVCLEEGSCCDLFAEDLIFEILKDISDNRHELLLQVQFNSHAKFLKEPAMHQKNVLHVDKKNSDQELCIAALCCLRKLLMLSASFIKPSCTKIIQNNILKIVVSFNVLHKKNVYSSWHCRLEVFKVMHILILLPHRKCPPPMEIIFGMLHQAQIEDPKNEIRLFCKSSISLIEKLIHPEKESLVFPIDTSQIKRSFLQLGQERLLCESLLIPKLTSPEVIGEKSTSGNINDYFDNITDVFQRKKEGDLLDERLVSFENKKFKRVESVFEDENKVAATSNVMLHKIESNQIVGVKNGNANLLVPLNEDTIEAETKAAEKNYFITSSCVEVCDINLCGPVIGKRPKLDNNINVEKDEKKSFPNVCLEDKLMAEMEAAFVEEFNLKRQN